MNDGNIVLLIDDDEITNFISVAVIERTNKFSHIEIAGSGKEGLEYLQTCLSEKKNLPSLILLDINMPIMTGWQFLEELERFADRVLEKAKIFMLSSSQNPEDLLKANKHPFLSGFIRKPLKFEKFIQLDI
jgi:CheY-like chemotaxis protein